MKTGVDALRTAENKSVRAKHENGDQRPRYRRNGPCAQNKKMGADAVGTDENESWRAKHENGTQLPRYRRKRFRARKIRKRDLNPSVPPKTSPGAQNMKTGVDALGIAENESEHSKQQNGTRRPRYRRKRVRARKSRKR
jgi:hypothetical protein